MVGLIIFKTKFLFKKFRFIFFFLLLLQFSCLIVYPNAKGDDTTINIAPASLSVDPNYNFNISIYCSPNKPIKAFELKLLFDSSVITADSVSEGDIFEGYPTFYNAGIINNSEGSIINIFNLIIGEGNVTDPGTLVTISFTSSSEIGSSDITLYDVGITNETNYISILTSDGSITVEFPYVSHIISSESPINNTEDVSVSTSSLSVSINDPEGDPFYWEISTSPDIGNSSGNNELNGTKTCEVSNLDYSKTYNWFVKCKDLTSNIWTNKSYIFSTEDSTVNPPPSGGGGGGGYFPPIDEGDNEPSNKPSEPNIPKGPIYVEKGVTYQYSTFSFDTDGDRIRYMFDWGDGTFSDWSKYFLSNNSVSLNHSFNMVSSYEIKVIAQDESGLNSSWSEPLEVIVSSVNVSEGIPIADIDVVNDSYKSNSTVFFDASNSYDSDGAIINYTWDFGDGEIGYGINIAHLYKTAGEYTVTLTVTDNDGNVYSSSDIINIAAESDLSNSEESTVLFFVSEIFFYLLFILIFSLVLFIFIFRKKISMIALDHKIKRLKK